MVKLRLREVIEPTLGHGVSCKAGLEPTAVLFLSLCIYAASMFMDVNPTPGRVNGEVPGSTWKWLQRDCIPGKCQGL